MTLMIPFKIDFKSQMLTH